MAEVERETATYVHWYNHTRLHSSIGYLPPVAYEQLYAEHPNPAATTPEVA